MGQNPRDFGLDKAFLDKTPTSRSRKHKLDKQDNQNLKFLYFINTTT